MPVRWWEGMPREEGVRDLVIAWTLEVVNLDGTMESQDGLERTIPVECACKD